MKRDAGLAQWVEPATLYLRFVRSSPTFDTEITLKYKILKKKKVKQKGVKRASAFQRENWVSFF